MRRRSSLFAFSLDEGVNLTPLLDIIFNLVFFFLLATTLRQQEAALNVELPTAGEATPVPKDSDTIIVSVTRANVITVDGRVLSAEELALHLRERAAAKSGLSLQVRGDAEADYQTMIRVMEAGSAAGISDIVFQVEKPRAQ